MSGSSSTIMIGVASCILTYFVSNLATNVIAPEKLAHCTQKLIAWHYSGPKDHFEQMWIIANVVRLKGVISYPLHAWPACAFRAIIDFVTRAHTVENYLPVFIPRIVSCNFELNDSFGEKMLILLRRMFVLLIVGWFVIHHNEKISYLARMCISVLGVGLTNCDIFEK